MAKILYAPRHECQVWGQNKNADTKEKSSIQDKAIQMISFKDHNTAIGMLYNEKKNVF